MIGIHFCGAAATLTAILIYAAGWKLRSHPNAIRDFALAAAAFSSTTVAMSAWWIVSSENKNIRVDIEIGAITVGLMCLSFGGVVIGMLHDHGLWTIRRRMRTAHREHEAARR